MKTFKPGKTNYLKENMFFGEAVSTARYDEQRIPDFERLIQDQLGFFWRPEEIDISLDRGQFEKLPEHEKHIFISNLKYQSLLDSIQGRSPNMAFLPICSLPEVETWIETWSFSETIHSRSYTHILRGIMNDPSTVFDDITVNPEIVKRAEQFTKYYDDLIKINMAIDLGVHEQVLGAKLEEAEELQRRALIRALSAVNALEAIAFYVSFACSFAFAERSLMEGNAKIIKLIARDEALHLIGTQLKINRIRQGLEGEKLKASYEAIKDELYDIFMTVVQNEKVWADYLFKDGSMIGLNKDILCQFVEFIANVRMSAIGFALPFPNQTTNPLPWIFDHGYLSSSQLQVAPQEAELSDYETGNLDTTIDDDAFGDDGLFD
jgi:ribonucleoside-diphosphate reductase beta chain